jgi:hypothetical protein
MNIGGLRAVKTVRTISARYPGRCRGWALRAQRDRWGGGAGIGAALQLSDWVRIRKAVRRDDALADRSIIVVTQREILAFNAALLRVRKAPRELGRWRRAEVVARAGHATGPRPPAWVETGYTPPPVLRLDTRMGVRLAEVKPVAWDDGVRGVFEALTAVNPRSE